MRTAALPLPMLSKFLSIKFTLLNTLYLSLNIMEPISKHAHLEILDAEPDGLHSVSFPQAVRTASTFQLGPGLQILLVYLALRFRNTGNA